MERQCSQGGYAPREFLSKQSKDRECRWHGGCSWVAGGGGRGGVGKKGDNSDLGSMFSNFLQHDDKRQARASASGSPLPLHTPAKRPFIRIWHISTPNHSESRGKADIIWHGGSERRHYFRRSGARASRLICFPNQPRFAIAIEAGLRRV